MRNLQPVLAALSAAALLSACNGSPLFFAELEEPKLCKTIPADELPPFIGTPPGSDLRFTLPIPIASELPLFAAGGDGGSDDTVTEIRLIEYTLVARSGIIDFNQIETAQITVQPPPGSSQAPAVLVTYAKDPAHLPGDRLVVGGDQGVNIAAYLFDPGTTDAGVFLDAGTATEGSVLVEATMTGVLPEDYWTADMRVCIYMRTRFNYLNAYGL